MVATPIGNLRDITLRALDVLERVDLIAAEDTRTTGNLLKHFSIRTKLFSLHQHNEHARVQAIVERLGWGGSIALVSDAGTPAVSDPGALLVRAVRAAGFAVVPVPGANAAVAALSATGLRAAKFLFYGFLSSRQTERKHELESLRALPFAMVFHEAPHRVQETVRDLAQVLGAERTLTIARELTKRYEAIHSAPLGVANAWLEEDCDRQRGEFVLIVEGAPLAPLDPSVEHLRHTLAVLLREVPLKQAVQLGVELTGASRKTVYALALEMKQSESLKESD